MSANASSAKPSAAAGAKAPSDSWQLGCEPPLSYALQEGKFAFSIQVTDKAGLKSQKDWAIVVDNTPPVASMITAPFSAQQPPEVTLQFKGARPGERWGAAWGALAACPCRRAAEHEQLAQPAGPPRTCVAEVGTGASPRPP